MDNVLSSFNKHETQVRRDHEIHKFTTLHQNTCMPMIDIMKSLKNTLLHQNCFESIPLAFIDTLPLATDLFKQLFNSS